MSDFDLLDMSKTQKYEARVLAKVDFYIYFNVDVPSNLSDRNKELYIEDVCTNAYYDGDLEISHGNGVVINTSIETVERELDGYSITSL